jgi:hypothetical protein
MVRLVVAGSCCRNEHDGLNNHSSLAPRGLIHDREDFYIEKRSQPFATMNTLVELVSDKIHEAGAPFPIGPIP